MPLRCPQVFEYLSDFRKYDWLWKEDKDVQYKRFVASNPAISDYEAELAKFMDIESEIEAIPTFHNIGPLTLNTTNIKLQLVSESRQWKIQYSNKVWCGAVQCNTVQFLPVVAVVALVVVVIVIFYTKLQTRGVIYMYV